MTVLVTGAGGFIGGHVARALVDRGIPVRAVDIKPLAAWHQLHPDTDNRVLDCAELAGCREAVSGCSRVYNFAADMGGMGFIESHKAACMLSVLINTHLIVAARDEGVERYFFASSAWVYPGARQRAADAGPLAEAEAYPADPEDGYGWEKLFSERMCRHFREDFGLATRVARYHNVYGPHGTWDGGREKAPAAICRKIALAKASGRLEIDIWSDGEQVRSFMHIDACVAGTLRLADSDVADPLNVGSDELVTINALVSLVEDIAGIRVRRRYQPEAPTGVRARNSDNTMIRERLGWAPGHPPRGRDGIHVPLDQRPGRAARQRAGLNRGGCERAAAAATAVDSPPGAGWRHKPLSAGGSMKRVTGIGGIFFTAKDPAAMHAWYKKHLGIDVQEWGGAAFTWTDAEGKPTGGTTIWSVGGGNDYFAPSKSAFMVNYRVADLHALLAALRAEGCQVLDKVDESEYGKFGWVMDPEGNKVELWQPPAGQ